MAFNLAETPVVVSMSFNEAAPDAHILQQRGDLSSLDTLIYSYSIKNIADTYWSAKFGGTYIQFNNVSVTININGIILNRVYTTTELITYSNSFYISESSFVIYVHINYSNVNSRAYLSFAGAKNRLNFVDGILDFKNPSNVRIDNEIAYPILNINDITKRIDDNIGGIALIDSVSFGAMNHKNTPLNYAVGDNVYNAIAEIYANSYYVNKIDYMLLLFKGFVSDFSYSEDNINFTIQDFRNSFSNIFCNVFNLNNYYILNAIYEIDNNTYIPYLYGEMQVELIEIAAIETYDNADPPVLQNTKHYYIAIDKVCNNNPFDLNKIYDGDGNPTFQGLSLYDNFILQWFEDKTSEEDQIEPKSAFVIGNQSNKVLDIVKAMFIFQNWNWDLEINKTNYDNLYAYSPRVNLLIEDDTTTKEIITTVCEDDMLYIFHGWDGLLNFGHYPGFINNKDIPEVKAVWFIDSKELIEYPEISYENSYSKFTSQILIKYRKASDKFTEQYVSLIMKDKALANYNKSVNTTIESNLANLSDIQIFATNYFRRYNYLSAKVTLQLNTPIFNFKLLDLVLCNFTELGYELPLKGIWTITEINYTQRSIVMEELPYSDLSFFNLNLDDITATLDTIDWSVDQYV